MTVQELIDILTSVYNSDDEVRVHTNERFDLAIYSVYDGDGIVNIDVGDAYVEDLK
jgi:hypothetical protein